MAAGPKERMTEADQQRFIALNDHYMRHAHAVQSGVAALLEMDETYATPKDMRTGIDCSKADMGGLVELLIQKGIFTDIEYMEAIVASMSRERERLEKDIGERLGRKVTLR
jgi:hypothetical protein